MTRKTGEKEDRMAENPLLKRLREEKAGGISGGIYHKVQIELTYNSNHMEGSRLSQEQTRYIFETNTLGVTDGAVGVDDIIETTNHFRCVDRILDQAGTPLTEAYICELHRLLKTGTSDSHLDWFAVGGYKKIPNEVGGRETTEPEKVAAEMQKLLASYEKKSRKTIEDLLDFHVRFECIHPFQDGNGRVGRLLLFQECLRYGIVPFIINDTYKMFYYREISEWQRERGYLLDTCLSAQDRFQKYLDYFRIPYEK